MTKMPKCTGFSADIAQVSTVEVVRQLDDRLPVYNDRQRRIFSS